jgi:hypothetical protein
MNAPGSVRSGTVADAAVRLCASARAIDRLAVLCVGGSAGLDVFRILEATTYGGVPVSTRTFHRLGEAGRDPGCHVKRRTNTSANDEFALAA